MQRCNSNKCQIGKAQIEKADKHQIFLLIKTAVQIV